MKPVELILAHWDSITEVYSKTKSWAKVYDQIQPLRVIKLATVRQYYSIIHDVIQELDKQDKLDKVIQNELDKVIHERDDVIQELDKQIELNKVIQNELDRVIQERDEVRQELANAKRLDNRLYTDERLNMVSQDNQEQAEVKQKLNICGWSIQQDRKGYYRAFKRIGGRLRSLYLGKSLGAAEDRIETAERSIADQES